MSPQRVPRQRAVIDRRALADAVAALHVAHGPAARGEIVKALRSGLDEGRAELARRLAEAPSAGHDVTAGYSFLMDQLLRVIHDHVTAHLYPVPNRTQAERLAILAVGGYGRAEMAPHSDVDVAFITPSKRAPWCEQVIETMLYLLWDLGL
ncbi:MAG: DUF294 nucleotidyltransferase-like domain-containing protein, partial [Sphingomonas sp.]